MNGAVFDLFMYPLEKAVFAEYRRMALQEARGEVLELGSGTGSNLRWYPAGKISRLMLTDFSTADPVLRRKALSFSMKTGVPVHIEDADAEKLAYPDCSYDTVVSTLLFCSVEHPERGLREILRVLKPGGLYLYIEHILPTERKLTAGFLKTLTPFWRRIAGGCRLDRRTDLLIERNGFASNCLQTDASGIILYGKAVK